MLDVFTNQKREFYISLLFFVVIFFLLLLDLGKFLILIFPLSAMLVGGFLFFRAQNLYVGFTIWLWFLNPLIKRVIDYQCGYYTTGGLFTTAQFVAAISLITFVAKMPNFYRRSGLPFFLCSMVVFFASLSGIVQNTFRDFLVVTTILGWICPISFGCFIFLNWSDYILYRETLKKVFFWGVIILGLYGIYQFAFAPEWDKFWLLTTGLNSRGKPEPFGIRVWSTMSAAHHVSVPLVAGIMYLLYVPKELKNYIFTAIAVTTLMLTRVRTSWISLVLSLVIYWSMARLKVKLKIVAGVGIIACIVIFSFLSIEEFGTVIGQRFSSFNDLSSDQALALRVEGYDEIFVSLALNPIGQGFGGSVQNFVQLSDGDSTFLSMLLWFGLLGTLVYNLGILLCYVKILIKRSFIKDDFLLVSKAISIGILPMTLTGQLFASGAGFFYWVILSFTLSGYRYYDHLNAVEVSGKY